MNWFFVIIAEAAQNQFQLILIQFEKKPALDYFLKSSGAGSRGSGRCKEEKD